MYAIDLNYEVIERSIHMSKVWDKTPRNDRFDPIDNEATMKAVVTANNGGYEKLECREVRMPTLEPGEVLIQVLAAGVNNTEINTRIGWYSSAVVSGTNDTSDTELEQAAKKLDGGWNEETPFPFIQGTDCCGRVVAVASAEDESLIKKRVLVRACIRKFDFNSMENIWMGSDFDGAFAQYVKVAATEVFAINCDWTDVELATIPCAYGTAENMIHRGKLSKGEKILVTGASGGVGSALVQLAKRRGAIVTAVASKSKADRVATIGADRVINRGENMISILGEEYFDIVIDNVAGSAFGDLLKLLKRNGRYVSSGAIGGPLVSFDMRTFYLKDLTLIGCTGWDEPVFPNLVSYIEKGEIKPLVAKIFPLDQIATAQKEFLERKHVGNFVLIPPKIV